MDIPLIITGAAMIATVTIGIYLLVKANHQIKALQCQLSSMREVDEVRHARAVADGFYDNVLEADITNNTLLGDNCKKLIAQLGLPEDATFSDCIAAVVKKIVKEEYQELYLEKFKVETLLAQYARGEEKFYFEFEEKADLVHYCWTRVAVCLYYSETGQAVKLVSYVKNIQEEKERELRLQEQANTDYLTGLFNKRATEEKVHGILSAENSQQCHALILVDIDRFKQINDTIGHLGGDKVLHMVANILREHFDTKDIIGRIGGDEFLIFMRNCTSAEAVEEKLKSLMTVTSLPHIQAQLGVRLTLSIGVAMCPEHADQFIDLFAVADSALYHVKEYGRSGYYLHHEIVPLSHGSLYEERSDIPSSEQVNVL